MMKFLFNKKIMLVMGLLLIAIVIYLSFSTERTIDFSAEVKPILNKKCITCHGGVKAKAGFSVLFRDEALANTESGKPAIIPGDPEHSEMIRRLSLKDPEERMPYKHEALSKQEIKTLTLWVKQGAKWGDHWAYLPLQPVAVPSLDNVWPKNAIDQFILAKLTEEKLTPSPEADKSILLRRVSLDLTGTYPSEAVTKQYFENTNSHAYELLVDSLLASPRYGERWASMWLDIARYADSKGYEADVNRNIWKYRDWVIDAFNKDQPYDEFLTEQIAGDLLPDPTDAQYIATAFSRNTMTNDEGGTDNEEFRTAAVMDRVSSTWEGLLSTTFACVQCHSHPYDPFKHDEYYKFLAYFNNTRDEDTPSDYPLLRGFNDTLKEKLSLVTDWVAAQSGPEQAKKVNKFVRTFQPSINGVTADSLNSHASIANHNNALLYRNHSVSRLKNVDLEKTDQLLLNLYCNTKGGRLQFRMDSAKGRVFAATDLIAQKDWHIESIIYPEEKGVHDVYVTYDNEVIPKSNDDVLIVFDWFGFLQQFPGKGQSGFEDNNKRYWELLKAPAITTPILLENPLALWRKSHVFERGNRNTLGKEVLPAVPASLNFAMPANAPDNRMGLAMWLTDKKNPLVARTITNRLWEQLFGVGIVETLEDMGTQGIAPTHKELLDHLSWKLMQDDKWSLKKLLKEMVMSATYRQDSKLTSDILAKDKENKFYARGPRVRLSAEQIRDQDLCISGVMSQKMYGPGVMPWQPGGIWLSPYNGETWSRSEGEDQYRRAVYTFWKRSAPYPSMISFDGAQRVVCSARRIRTNTPLQALTTLNDSVYLDMARHFALRMQRKGGKDVQQQIAEGYEMMLFRKMPANKLKVMTDLYDESLQQFSKDETSTCEMVGLNSTHTNAPTAALVVVANAMLNLDEVVMKN